MIIFKCFVSFFFFLNFVYGDCPDKCKCQNNIVRCLNAKLIHAPDVPITTLTLDLRNNHIAHLPDNVFDNLNHLHLLMLNNNRVKVITDRTFKGLHNLKFLYLFRNEITKIDADAFRWLKHLQQLFLHVNRIEHLHPDTFVHLRNLERLNLHSNRIKHLSTDLFTSNYKLQTVRLENNPLICDCRMLWFIDLLKARLEKSSTLVVSGTCHHPNNLKGYAVVSLTENDLNCHEPMIIENPKNTTARSDKVMLNCKVYGNPRPVVIWMKNKNKIPLDDARYHLMSNGSLLIDSPDDKDVGTFECMARSVMGEAISRPARMAVYSKHYIEFTRKPTDSVVRPGNRVTALCLVRGNPKPEVVWFKGTERLKFDQRVNVYRGNLIINNVNEHDADTYTCRAQNRNGMITATFKVDLLSQPSFVERTPEKSVTTGDSVELVCKVKGRPSPVITWYKTSQPIVANDYIKLEDNSSKLIIYSVKESDRGLYVCTAENSEGFIEGSSNLIVHPFLGKKPELVVKPYDIETTFGSSIEIPCRSEGTPYPKIEWKKDGRTIVVNEKNKVSSFGSLYIVNITEEDVGRYQCTAINEHGTDTASGVLTIKNVNLPGNAYVNVAYLEAVNDIDLAVNKTIDQLFNPDSNTELNIGDLFRAVRFPNQTARHIARASEIYERTLLNIRKHVNAGMKVKATEKFDYRDILSPEHLELVATLSGCTKHREHADCSDVCFHSKYREIDGTCNNFEHPMWGASLTGFRRILPAVYENGFDLPTGWNKEVLYNNQQLPSARLVSSKIITTTSITEDEEITHMVMQWGQFLDHDLDHALPSISSQSWDGVDCKKTCEYAAPCFPIEVPLNDTRVQNRRCIDFIRTSSVCGSGMTSVFFGEVQPREQINQLTSYLDASQVYGYSKELATDLRNLTSADGLLREGIVYPNAKPLLPFAGNQGVDCRRDLSQSNVNCFVAGDIRVNEQVGLTAMHTIWMREHNRIARELKTINPFWDGEILYQEARKIVGAMMQHITYKDWLPIIIGKQGMDEMGNYTGYNPTINPAVSNVFSTAALRFGHSLINPMLERLDENFETIPQGNLDLHKAFFSPWRITDEGGVDPLLRGMFMSPAKLKRPNENLNSELTEKLFISAHAVALDLAAMNVQRSRDHAIPPYVKWREYCKMPTVKDFDDLKNEISDSNIRNKLKELYGTTDNIDVWVGGILEDQVSDGKVGPLFRCILVEQFKRLRDGDRFWYENPSTFKLEQLVQLKKTNLARVLCDNGDNIDTVNENVFILPDIEYGLFDCRDLSSIDLRFWKDCKECKANRADDGEDVEPDTVSLSRIVELENQIQNYQNLVSDITNRINKLEAKLKDEF